jgi:hypothetical protein
MTSRPQNAAQTLRACADLLRPPGAWTKKVWARDLRGEPLFASSPSATCWCAVGAITRVDPPQGSYAKVYRCLYQVIGETHLPTWNDVPARTQAEVVAAFEKAAELAERR